MKKMPLVVLTILILMVVISGLAESDNTHPRSDERPDGHRDGSVPPLEVFSLSSMMDEENFLEDNIEKSESMVQRLENASKELENEGNDVSELNAMIIAYSDLVSESRSYLEMANTASSDSEKQQYLDLSRKNIIKANSELKPILDEIKQYLPGPVVIANTTLSAEGSGVAIISGDIDLSFFISEGKFSVVDFSDDLVIDTDGTFIQELVPERDGPDDLMMPHSMISYLDVTGNVSMSGSGYTVAIMADSISLTANGDGEAELVGNGTYYLDNGVAEEQENVWMIPIFEMADIGK